MCYFVLYRGTCKADFFGAWLLIEVDHCQVDQVAAEHPVVGVAVGVGEWLAGGKVFQGEGAAAEQVAMQLCNWRNRGQTPVSTTLA